MSDMTATPVLDDLTAAAIRDAVAALQAGRMADACRIGERALEEGGDPAPLNAMLGSFQCRAGNFAAGIQHFRLAHEARPDDIVVAGNLASALAEYGEHRAALDVLTEDLARGDTSMGVERLRGYLAQTLEDFTAAIAAYERVVAVVPSDWETWNNLGNARRLTGDLEGSVTALERAVGLNPSSPPVRFNFATALSRAGRIAEGEQELRKMAEDFPRDPLPLLELHMLLKELGREPEALEAIEAAAERDPSDLKLLLGVASDRLMLMRTEAAEAAYREAIARDPSNSVANLGLAVTFELTNRTSELAKLVEQAEQRGVGPDALNFIRAFHFRRSEQFAEGLAALANVDEKLESVRRWHLMGQLHDRAGQYDEGFKAFARMNELQRANPTRPEERAAAYRQTVRERERMMTPQWRDSWRDGPSADGRPSPVFLVGFPRSGTTLLDTMLMGHPQLQVLEEEPALNAAEELLGDDAGLPSLSDERIVAARDAYFRTAAEIIPLDPGKLLIDKNPLAMNLLPLIRRLFPDARIILALRHPCDAVLSCFMSNFKVNEGMSSFLRLDTAAELYDLSFRCFERAQELFQMPMHRVVYENVVADREAELRSLIEFLGIEWSDEVLDHESTARSRGRIKTASYAQVGQPIYTRSAGRWQNYRQHLEPVLPVLEPWVRKFGYSL